MTLTCQGVTAACTSCSIITIKLKESPAEEQSCRHVALSGRLCAVGTRPIAALPARNVTWCTNVASAKTKTGNSPGLRSVRWSQNLAPK